MSKLIILNGPPGVGKSTIAARLHIEIPNSIIVDVDELRRSIPNYKEHRKDSLLLSYEKAKEVIDEYLAKGQTVIVDKAISYSDTLDSFITVGKKYHAEIYKILLFANKDTVQRRADIRGYKPGSLLTRERVGEMWEQVNTFKEESDSIVVDTSSLNLEEVYTKVKEVVELS